MPIRPAKDFIVLLKQNNGLLRLEQFDGDIIVNEPEDVIGQPWQISKCSFGNCELFTQIKAIELIRCGFRTLKIKTIGVIQRLTITGCRIENLIIDGDVNEFVISDEQSRIKTVNISGSFTKLDLNNCSIDKGAIVPERCDEFQSLNLKFSSLSFAKSFKNIIVNGGNKNTLSFADINVSNEIIIESTQETSLVFARADLKNVKIRFPLNDSRLTLSDIEAGTFVLHGGAYDLFRCSGVARLTVLTHNEGQTETDDIQFRRIELSNLTVMADSMISLSGVTTQELHIKDSENGGQLRIVNTVIHKRLSIIRSYLNKAVFSNVMTVSDCMIDLLDSDISDTTFSAFHWNNHHSLDHTYTEGKHRSDASFALALREGYRQLKANYLRQNNKVLALEFQKHELNIHSRILATRRKEKGEEIFKSWSSFNAYLNALGNYLIIWTYNKSCDFGTNIWKPVTYLLIFHLVFFNLLLYCNPDLNLHPFINVSWEATIDAWGKYFYTLLPFHYHSLPAFDREVTQNVFIAGFPNLIMRISSGYFIYYFLIVGRKYHHQQ